MTYAWDDGADEGEDDGGHRRRRGRRAPRWTWVLGVLLLAVLGSGAAYWRWGNNAQKRLTAAIEDLRRRGEPVYATDLTHPPVAGADNAAIDLRAAAGFIDPRTDAWKAFQQIDFAQPLSEQAKREAAAMLATDGARRALERVRVARAKPAADWQIPMRSPLISVLLPDMNEQRSLASVLRAAVLDAGFRGDHAAAVEHLRDLLAVSRAVDEQTLLVSHLVSVGIAGAAVDHVEQVVPTLEVGAARQNVRPASPEQVGKLIAELLDDGTSDRAMRQALRAERVMQLDTAQLLADRKLPPGVLAAGGGGGMPILPRAMILADARIMLDHTTATIAAFEKASDWPEYSRNAPAVPFILRPGRGRHMVASLLLPAFEHAIRNHFRIRADRRMAATALAVRWYAAENSGELPATLDALVPKYLPSVPSDPFASGGKPLRYRRDPEPIVYSVGNDGRDQGGSETSVNPRKPAQARWDMQDAVFRLAPKPPAAAPP